MNSNNLIKTFALFILGFVCLTACSDDEEDNTPSGGGGTVTEKLLPPENVTCTPSQSYLHFAWDAVSGATSYEASLILAETGVGVGDAETTNTFCDFYNLNVSTSYTLRLRAVYKDNSDYNSEYVELTVSTLDYEKLDTPTNLACSDITSSSVTITWDDVNEAFNYRVIVEDSSEERVATRIVGVSSCTVTGLTESTSYTASVQALIGDGTADSEFDSELAYIDFVTSGPDQLTAPTLSVYAKGHGFVVVEWALSDAAQLQQTLGKGDSYDFRLESSSGAILRDIVDYTKFDNWGRYPHPRFIFGGLSANTQYTVEIKRNVTSDSSYLDSEWASVTFTTDAEPDTSGYLVYWDFENVPFAANPIYWAYGMSFSGSSSTDYSDPFNVTLTIPSGSNTVDTQGFDAISGAYNESFINTYLPGILATDFDGSDYSDKLTSNIAVGTTFFKFGGSSKPAWLTLPPLTNLSSSATQVVLDFDACPYYEPGSEGTNPLTSHQNSDEVEYFYVVVPTGCTITKVEGENASSAVISGQEVKLKNVTGSQMNSEGLDTYRYTNHKVYISGATSSSRFQIYTVTENDGAQHRMWMSNVKIYEAD